MASVIGIGYTFFVIIIMMTLLLLGTTTTSHGAAAPPYGYGNNNIINVIKFGAKPDGKTDSTEQFKMAWKSACTSIRPATIYVPKGRYLLKYTNFRGPCKNNKVTFIINGTLVAPYDYNELANSGGFWILFNHVDNLTVIGGNLDAQGSVFWDCRRSGKNCPVGARSMTFNWVNNLVISGITSINSQLSHIVINTCNNVIVKNVRIIAPDQSPNTDGIHVEHSKWVNITGTTIQTGDDCISIGDATFNLFMDQIKCGPGHGVSIGSLAKEMEEEGVANVSLRNAIFYGSDNGMRIKSWARASKGFVRNILFQDITMFNVQNPIIIDQNYCPNNQGCPAQTSGIEISEVTYKNIHGSSATSEAVTFDCSASNPCQGIKLHDINLTYNNKPATSSCNNIRGTTSGTLVLQSCL